MRYCCLFILLVALTASVHAAEPVVVEHGDFTLTLDPEDSLLPASLRYKPAGVELLDPKLGLHLSFVSFEFHSKIYHDESPRAWAGQTDPRFFADAELLGQERVEEDGFAGVEVRLRTSFADVRRRVLLHGAGPRVRVRYRLTFSRPVVVHESQNLAVGLKLSPAFTRQVMALGAGDQLEQVEAPVKQVALSSSVLHAGPVLALAEASGETGVALLVSRHAAGDVAEPAPVQFLRFEAGRTLELGFDLTLHDGNTPGLRQHLVQEQAKLPAWRRPFHMVEVASLRLAAGQVDQAERDLLAAAQLNDQHAQPLGALAALRRDHKRPGETEAWAAAGYRMPYNYGYLLSASGLHKRAGLSEADRRQHLFNLLIAVENIPFYPDYYTWAARGFEEINMPVQAAAIHRQALWALERAPYAADKRQKLEARFRAKLAELEAKIIDKTSTDLPEPVPVGPAAGAVGQQTP